MCGQRLLWTCDAFLQTVFETRGSDTGSIERARLQSSAAVRQVERASTKADSERSFNKRAVLSSPRVRQKSEKGRRLDSERLREPRVYQIHVLPYNIIVDRAD